MDKESFSARSNFFDQVCNNSLEWQYAAQSPDGSQVVLVNEKKFLVCYDVQKDKIVNSFIMDLVGELCRCSVEENGREIYLANKEGRFVSFELETGHKLFDI